jgi:hypothetical protein
VLGSNPDDTGALINRGACCQQLGQTAVSRRWLRSRARQRLFLLLAIAQSPLGAESLGRLLACTRARPG